MFSGLIRGGKRRRFAECERFVVRCHGGLKKMGNDSRRRRGVSCGDRPEGRRVQTERNSRSLTSKRRWFGMTCSAGKTLAVAGFAFVVEGFEEFIGAHDLAVKSAGNLSVAFAIALFL